MCDNCLDPEEVLDMLDVPDDERDPISLAKKRLLCYYKCVSEDIRLPDDDTDDDDALGLPRY